MGFGANPRISALEERMEKLEKRLDELATLGTHTGADALSLDRRVKVLEDDLAKRKGQRRARQQGRG